jgi:hypothetical protein
VFVIVVSKLLGVGGSHSEVRHQRLIVVGLFVLSFALYLATMSRGITWLNNGMDGGDFISAARAFGVPHPTGYPTYTLLLRVWGDLVAIGDHAFRANLLSAFLGALTVPLVYVAASRLVAMLPTPEVGGRASVRASAVVAALAFATSRVFWSQSTITEVHTLNALFGAALLVLALGVVRDISESKSMIRTRVLMTFLLGFGLGNHTTLGIAATPFALWVLWLVWKSFGWRGVLDWRPALGLFAGLSVYVYVPIAASAAPIVSWGAADSFEGFRWIVSATIYRQYAFGLSSEFLPGRIATIAELLFTQFTVVGTVIGIAGLTTIWSYSRAFVIASVASVLAIAVYAVAYDTLDSFIYLISAFMLFSLWLAVGVAVLGQGLRRLSGRMPSFKRFQRTVYVGVFVVVVLIVPVWSMAFGWSEISLAGNDESKSYAQATVAVAAGGVVLAEEPELFTLVFQAQVANPELDVMIVGPVMLAHDWYWDQLVQYYGDRMPPARPDGFLDRVESVVAHNLGIVPIYSTDDDRDHHDLMNLVPEGDLFKVEF